MNSRFERHADTIARKFGTPPGLGGVPNSPMHPIDIPGSVEDQIHRAKGQEDTRLDPVTRGLMSPAFGGDISDVRVHNGPGADALARALEASAFSVGKHVFFRNGMYRPETQSGRSLLAHEIAHTQQPSELVQRTIYLEGDEYRPRNDNERDMAFYERLQTLGDRAFEIYHEMREKDAGVFYYRDLDELFYDIKFRISASKAIVSMERGNNCCSYGGGGASYHLNPKLWSPAYPTPMPDLLDTQTPRPEPGDGLEAIYFINAGQSPSEAVKSIFADGAKTELECNSMMTALQYRGMLEALGSTKFDKIFASNPQWTTIGPAAYDEINQQELHPMIEQFYVRETVAIPTGDETKNLVSGDWVYFTNHPNYLKWYPSGAWQGENAMYVGGGEFSGFGLRRNDTKITLTYAEVIDDMLASSTKAHTRAKTGDPAPVRSEIAGLAGPGGVTTVRRLDMASVLAELP